MRFCCILWANINSVHIIVQSKYHSINVIFSENSFILSSGIFPTWLSVLGLTVKAKIIPLTENDKITKRIKTAKNLQHEKYPFVCKKIIRKEINAIIENSKISKNSILYSRRVQYNVCLQFFLLQGNIDCSLHCELHLYLIFCWLQLSVITVL